MSVLTLSNPLGLDPAAEYQLILFNSDPAIKRDFLFSTPTEILTMPTTRPMSSHQLRRHRLTVVDYYKIGAAGVFMEKDRVELIEGEIIDMVPIGSQHAYTINKILNRFLKKQLPDNILARIQDPLCLDQYNQPEPDLALVVDKNYSNNHPGPDDTLLIIEVADSSLSYDIDIKSPLYARFNIPELWVVNINERKIHAFQQPRNGVYQQQNEITDGILSPSQLASFVLDLNVFWNN